MGDLLAGVLVWKVCADAWAGNCEGQVFATQPCATRRGWNYFQPLERFMLTTRAWRAMIEVPPNSGRDKSKEPKMTEAIPSTIRHARTSLDLIVNGAIRHMENQFASVSSNEFQEAITKLIDNLHDELNGWMQPGGTAGND